MESISMLSITQQICDRAKPGSRLHSGLPTPGPASFSVPLTSLRNRIIHALQNLATISQLHCLICKMGTEMTTISQYYLREQMNQYIWLVYSSSQQMLAISIILFQYLVIDKGKIIKSGIWQCLEKSNRHISRVYLYVWKFVTNFISQFLTRWGAGVRHKQSCPSPSTQISLTVFAVPTPRRSA